MRPLSGYFLLCFIALLCMMVPFKALVVAVEHDANTHPIAPGIKERNHPHGPTTNHIPQEELDALTNGERFKRYAFPVVLQPTAQED